MKNESKENKRECLRVSVYFPIVFAISNKDSFEKEKSGILAHPTAEHEQYISSLCLEGEAKNSDPALVKMWVSLEKKMDYIIHLLKKNDATDCKPELEGVCVDISEKGFQIISDEIIDIGELFLFDIEPPVFPPLKIKVFGKAIWRKDDNKESEKLYRYGVDFYIINTEDKERLIRYIFKRQREVIRREKGENVKKRLMD